MSDQAVTWIVGFSGGLDSTVLLHRFARSLAANHDAEKSPEGLVAVHVNHQLQPYANEWGRHCAAEAKKFGVPFIEYKLIGEPAPGDSIEAWARAGRMEALATIANRYANPTILLAHHQQDQAETFLFRALRGAGAHGLASIAPVGQWHGVPVHRPLMNESRTSLAAYAQAENLKWIEDPSNKDERFTRNAIRTQVIPSLRRVKLDAVERINNTVRSLADDAQLLAEIGLQDWISANGKASILSALSEVRSANALRAWVRLKGAQSPSRMQMEEMQGQLLSRRRKYSHSGQVTFNGWLWTRYRDQLEAAPLPTEEGVDWFSPPGEARIQWQDQQGVLAKGFAAHCRILETELVKPSTVAQRRFGHLSLRVPASLLPGLKVAPLGGACNFRLAENRPTRSLKLHCQALGIASIARPWLPVICYEDTPLLAAGVGVNMEAQAAFAKDADTQIELSWEDTKDCRRAFL